MPLAHLKASTSPPIRRCRFHRIHQNLRRPPMATSSRKANLPEPMSMLVEDHQKVQKMFKQFEKLKDEDASAKRDLVTRACAELKVHTQIEEEIFYPAAREGM